MSRSARRGKNAAPDTPKRTPALRVSWDLTRLVRWILDRPRVIRILMVAFFALSVTLAVFPIIDSLYVRFMFDESTVILPSFVSAALGIIMYIFGWRLIIGTIGDRLPVRSAVFWYVVVGILAILLVIGLMLQGYSIAITPTE